LINVDHKKIFEKNCVVVYFNGLNIHQLISSKWNQSI